MKKFQVTFLEYDDEEVPYTEEYFDSKQEAENWANEREFDYWDDAWSSAKQDYVYQQFFRYHNPEDNQVYYGYEVREVEIKESSSMKLTKIVEDLYQQMTGKIDDHEAEMAITDLKSIASRAAQLAAHLEKGGHQELEGWIQSKITKSADYINAVYDNFMFSPDHECNSCGDGLNEEKSTCCGKCGRFHVKGTTCPKPYLTGKKHCRNRPK